MKLSIDRSCVKEETSNPLCDIIENVFINNFKCVGDIPYPTL